VDSVALAKTALFVIIVLVAVVALLPLRPSE
jgi:hypothetical protein